MTTYKYTDATNTVVHVIDDDGISRSSMLATLVPEGEQIEPYVPTAAELNAPILAEIAAVESKQNRVVREALLNQAGAADRLTAIDAQIAALRAQLV